MRLFGASRGKSTHRTLLPAASNSAKSEQKGDFSALLSPYSPLRSQDGQIYAFQNLSPYGIAQNFETIPPLYTAMSRLSGAVSALPFKVVDLKTREDIPDHPASALLANPNTELQKIKMEYVRDYIMHRVMLGNAYIAMTGPVNKPPIELYLLNPLFVITEVDGTSTYPKRFRYEPGGSAMSFYYTRPPGSAIYVPESGPRLQEVYRVTNYNVTFSTNQPDGKSEIRSLYYEINHYLQMSQHNLALLANGARPSGVFTLVNKDNSPAILSEDSFKRLKEQVNSSYTGAQNAGRPLLLEGGMQWQQMEMTPRDLDFAKLAEASEERIYKVLNIPMQLVMSQKVTANNMTNIRLEFYENRILPLGEEFVAHFNNSVMRRFPDTDKVEMVIDRDAIDVLIPQRAARRKMIESSTTLTINEKRKMFHNAPIKLGDKVVDANGRPIAGPDADTIVQATPPAAGAPKPAAVPPKKDAPDA